MKRVEEPGPRIVPMYVSLLGASASAGTAAGSGIWLFWVAAVAFLVGAWSAI